MQSLRKYMVITHSSFACRQEPGSALLRVPRASQAGRTGRISRIAGIGGGEVGLAPLTRFS